MGQTSGVGFPLLHPQIERMQTLLEIRQLQQPGLIRVQQASPFPAGGGQLALNRGPLRLDHGRALRHNDPLLDGLPQHHGVGQELADFPPDQVVEGLSPQIWTHAGGESVPGVAAPVIVIEPLLMAAGRRAHRNEGMATETAPGQAAQQPSLLGLEIAGAEALVLGVPLLGPLKRLRVNPRWDRQRDPFRRGARFCPRPRSEPERTRFTVHVPV